MLRPDATPTNAKEGIRTSSCIQYFIFALHHKQTLCIATRTFDGSKGKHPRFDTEPPQASKTSDAKTHVTCYTEMATTGRKMLFCL